MLRDRRHGGDVLAADGHSLTGFLHAHGWDVFVILKAGGPG